jgi:uncharacterized caspase-like protein
LKASGFAVTALMDAGKDALLQAIRDYVHAMEQKKAVGLFYFAGHGVQLDWRNYMLPWMRLSMCRMTSPSTAWTWRG